MASTNSYPNALNSFTGSETLGNAHSSVHNALEAKLGTGASTPTNNMILIGTGAGSSSWSLPFPGGSLVTTTSTSTLTNKTLGQPLYSGFAGASLGDIFYVESDLSINRLPIGALNNVLTVDGTGRPSWTVGGGVSGVANINGIVGAISILGTTNQVNVVNGVGTITLSTPQDIATSSTPQFNTIDLTGAGAQAVGVNGLFQTAGGLITANGVLAPSQGGLGFSTYTKGDILYAPVTGNTLSKLPIGTVGQVLAVSGANLPSWSSAAAAGVTSINAGGGAVGGVLTFAGTTNRVTINQVGNNFTWTAPQDIDINANVEFNGLKLQGLTASQPVFTDGAKNLTSVGIVPAINGGTGYGTYNVGDILYANTATSLLTLPAGANGQVLTLAGGVPTWAASSGGGGFASYVVAGPNASVAIGFNINTNVTNYNEIIDVLNEFDPVTGVFTAAATGRYFVDARIAWIPVVNLTGDHQVHINFSGVEWRQGGSGSVTSTASDKYSNVTTIVSLTAGQTLVMSGRVDFGAGTGGTMFGNGTVSLSRLIIKRIE